MRKFRTSNLVLGPANTDNSDTVVVENRLTGKLQKRESKEGLVKNLLNLGGYGLIRFLTQPIQWGLVFLILSPSQPKKGGRGYRSTLDIGCVRRQF